MRSTPEPKHLNIPVLKPFRFVRDASRAREIITVLVRYGFEDLLKSLNLPSTWVRRVVSDKDGRIERMTIPQRIRYACEDLGPTFVKIGQILSSRPDLLGPVIVEELKNLRDDVESIPIEEIEKRLDSELGQPWSEVFSSINVEPTGSASLAQVHKGVLREGEHPVALKVRRPGIEKALSSDMEILSWLAKNLHRRIKDIQAYDLPTIVDALEAGVRQELDFRVEAVNSRVFNEQNPYKEDVFAPKVYEELSSKRLLVMEHVEGDSADDADWTPEKKKQLARRGGESMFHQILIKGFFHADPHPGNILVSKDGRLCLLDWGLTGHLTQAMRWILADLLDAVVNQDARKLVRVTRQINRDKPPIDEQHLEIDIAQVLARHGKDFRVNQAGEIMLDLARALSKNGVKMSRDYTMLTKAIVSVEETGRVLDPEFDLVSIAEPFLRKLMLERYRPEQILRDFWLDSREWMRDVGKLPGDIQRVLRRIEKEDIGLNLRLDKLEKLAEPLDGAINRVVLGLIIGSLIIGSSMIMTTGTGPLLWGFPQLGLFGYLLSGLLGLWVVFDIIRHGRHR